MALVVLQVRSIAAKMALFEPSYSCIEGMSDCKFCPLILSPYPMLQYSRAIIP